MAGIPMYQASIATLTRSLKILDTILAKGAAHAEAHKIDPAVLIGSRLYPDMFALARQVQVATDTAKGCAARLAGVETPKFEDTETTFPELSARIAKTIDFLASVRPEQIDGSEHREIVLKLGKHAITFDGQAYLLNFVLPNFYFHVTTAYDILRHNGVPVGKLDYLGAYSS